MHVHWTVILLKIFNLPARPLPATWHDLIWTLTSFTVSFGLNLNRFGPWPSLDLLTSFLLFKLLATGMSTFLPLTLDTRRKKFNFSGLSATWRKKTPQTVCYSFHYVCRRCNPYRTSCPLWVDTFINIRMHHCNISKFMVSHAGHAIYNSVRCLFNAVCQ